MVDNTIIEKLPKVEYEIEIGCYDYNKEEEEPMEDEIMIGPSAMLYDYQSRPLHSTDIIFET